jgi:hypothetical protein
MELYLAIKRRYFNVSDARNVKQLHLTTKNKNNIINWLGIKTEPFFV